MEAGNIRWGVRTGDRAGLSLGSRGSVMDGTADLGSRLTRTLDQPPTASLAWENAWMALSGTFTRASAYSCREKLDYSITR